MLRDDGRLEVDSPRRASPLRPRSRPLTVPPTIYALVGARLDRLALRGASRDPRRSAVIGKLFWWGAVLDLVPAGHPLKTSAPSCSVSFAES